MEEDRVVELEARLRAEAEELDKRVMDALESGKISASIQGTFLNEATNTHWAGVDVLGSGPVGLRRIVMPKEKAEQYAEIVNDAHRHVDIILDAYLRDDPKRALDHVRQLFGTFRKARRGGRPRLAKGLTKAEQTAQYLERHGLEATIEHFGYSAETVVRYQRRANEERGQKPKQ
jgi:hypothetical protein